MDNKYYKKYLKYKDKYLFLKNQKGGTELNLNKYYLVGIGEFAHGIQESWEYRFKLLKKCVEKTDKHIMVFNEMSVWQSTNIMNNTIWDRKKEQFVPYDGIKIEKPVHGDGDKPSWGRLWQYMSHTSESQIVLEIIKYIQKNKDRITLVGVDNDTLFRDYDMFTIIKEKLNKNNINFLWAHNAHVDDRKLSWDNYRWTKDKYPDLKWFCGHYLKKEYGDKYCIILSTAYEGTIRFNGYCEGDACEERTWVSKYFYKQFRYKPNKRYVGTNNEAVLTKYNNPFIEFSNSYYNGSKQGEQGLIKSKGWNFVLFWNTVTRLVPN